MLASSSTTRTRGRDALAAGRPDSAELLRAIHDLALRAYQAHDRGERLVVVPS